jgi:hypothetical protein
MDNQGKERVGIGGFTLFALVSDTATRTAQVPSKVLEDGRIASDHIINEPRRITISGVVSDVFVDPAPVTTPERSTLGDSIGDFATFFTDRLEEEALRMARIDELYREVQAERRRDLFSDTEGIETKPVRQQFLDFVQGIYRDKALISVDTVDGILDDMAITSTSLVRDNVTKSVSFNLELVQVLTVTTEAVGIEAFYKAPAKTPRQQVSPVVDGGAQDVKGAGESGADNARSLIDFLIG